MFSFTACRHVLIDSALLHVLMRIYILCTWLLFICLCLLTLCMMLQQKMRDMKNHADALLDNILNHPNLTEPQINQMPLSQKEDLRRRVKIADDVSSICLLGLPIHCVETQSTLDAFFSQTLFCHFRLSAFGVLQHSFQLPFTGCMLLWWDSVRHLCCFCQVGGSPRLLASRHIAPLQYTMNEDPTISAFTCHCVLTDLYLCPHLLVQH